MKRRQSAILPAGLFVGAGIPKGNRSNVFVECGCCGSYHRADFTGDCREDSERFMDLPSGAVLSDNTDPGSI
jgi:hypothetical protein